MAESVFYLSPLITNNFDIKSKGKFLAKYRLHSDYTNSGDNFEDYVQKNIQTGKIEIDHLAKFFYEELLYGNQRQVWLFKLHSLNKKITSQNDVLECIQKIYPYIERLNVNKILYQPVDDEIKELVCVNTSLGLVANSLSVKKLTLIFSEKCTVTETDGMRGEYSYITVNIDLVNNLLYIKVKPKTLVEKEKKPEALMERYLEKVTKMFSMKFNDFSGSHKGILCQMNIDLYSQIYNQMVDNQPPEITSYISDMTSGILKILKIKNYEFKKVENNIFNIDDIIKKMVEHVMITDILCESVDSGTLDGVDGFVTYIRFSDGTNINARLKSKKSSEPIFSSEAFMALRSSIENSKQITELKIYWLNEFSGLRASYKATDPRCLEILLYKHHQKEEFEYAIAQYTECEQRTIEESPRPLALEA